MGMLGSRNNVFLVKQGNTPGQHFFNPSPGQHFFDSKCLFLDRQGGKAPGQHFFDPGTGQHFFDPGQHFFDPKCLFLDQQGVFYDALRQHRSTVNLHP